MLHLYNTLTHTKQAFVAIDDATVKMYSCGPTVYRYIHIGNLRTFCMSDWLRRVLLRRGYEVLHVKNITDVGHMRVELLDRGEDKLIAQARKEGKTSAEIAAFYTAAFLEDERRLHILPAQIFPRATEHVPEMLEIIQGLLERGMAYQAGDNIYFDVSTFPDYGRLSGNQLATLLAGVRDTADLYKRNPEDFALWKAAEPGREMAWESPWGRGFPGWHIECSAMSMRYLGQQFDIHTGGVDNIFPHHEDEIAQSQGYTGKPWVHYWVHAQHLLADGLKMAKSTGNAYTRADIEARGFDALALRYLYASTHYRARLNFSFSALRAAQKGLERLRQAVRHLQGSGVGGQGSETRGQGSGIRDQEIRSGGDSRPADTRYQTADSRPADSRQQTPDTRPADSRQQTPDTRPGDEEHGSGVRRDTLSGGSPAPAHRRLADTRYQTADRRPGVHLRVSATQNSKLKTQNSKHPLANDYRAAFDAALDDDLNLPRALAVVWELVRRAPHILPAEKLDMLQEFDQVLGFELFAAAHAAQAEAIPTSLQAMLEQRRLLRQERRYAEADVLRLEIEAGGFALRDTPQGTQLIRRAADQEFAQINRSVDIPDGLHEPDQLAFSINLIARDNREDLQRCIGSIVRHCENVKLEIVVLDNGSTDDTIGYLQELARHGLRDTTGRAVRLHIIFADHNLGFAAGRNATMRASRGQIIVLLDTSIELTGAIWTELQQALDNPEAGLVGPYGLLTDDLKEFRESNAGDVDAIEGYLMAFRRSLLHEIGWFDERFRFYRLLDIHTSFFVKAAGYRVIALPDLESMLIKHPHREWYSLSDEEQLARSKKNFDIYYRRWHHGHSLMTRNYVAGTRWFGHASQSAGHSHPAEDMPAPGQPHSHVHQHWSDHAHSHAHFHDEG